MMNLAEIAKKMATVVEKAAHFIHTEAGQFSTEKVEYKGLNDMVSYVDKQAEQILVEGLKNILPEAGFVAEEGTEGAWQRGDVLEDKPYWIIDPLDGTTNFVHGLPNFAVSVALWHKGQLLVGIVHEVMRGEQFVAWQGGGAWCNGKPIKVSAVPSLSQGLIATGFPYYDFGKMDEYLAILNSLMNKSHGLRRMGSAAVDLAYVACGRFEAFFEHNLKPWDVAAGCLLVQEAGGVVTDFTGGDTFLFGVELLATGAVHGQMQEVINEHWTGI